MSRPLRLFPFVLASLTLVPAALAAAPTVEEARAFVDRADEALLVAAVESERASWVQSTYITGDTELIAAQADERKVTLGVRLAHEAARFDGLELPDDVARRLALLKLALVIPAPRDAAKTSELSRLRAQLEGAYGAGAVCRDGECLSLGQLENILATSRDPALQLAAWQGWHDVAAPMRASYSRVVELGGEGARELGYPDLGNMWRSKYDLEADAFAAELDRLWGQVRPLYESLHCYVRRRLSEKYGPDVVPPQGPIPAHLLGNMWAQDWGNVYDLVAPPGDAPDVDLTALLVARKVDAVGMVRFGEGFFSSLGFAPLPDTFWERSMLTKPRDRDVVCHASAWDIDQVEDLRIKMCIEPTGEDFRTIHHELGHNYYQRAYNTLPMLFRDSANDGFHEAIGDTIALSVTPAYLVKLGFLQEEPDASADLGLLLRMALDKVAFLPWSLAVDQWRWKVFSGEIPPERYNAAWWELREKMQGVRPAIARDETRFDPGAKYHVAGGVPYSRYFLADLLQFQFHRALCATAGQSGPLHRCSIYGSGAAGDRLAKTLAMGASRPWPDALEALTGEREMDATAMLDYFAPLKSWLDEQNAGQTCGW